MPLCYYPKKSQGIFTMKKLAISLATIALIFIGCGEEKQKATTKQTHQMPPLPIQAQSVVLSDVNFTKSYSATLKPYEEVDVVARVSGLLQKQNFTEGSYVKKGALLYQIEKDEYEARLDAAKSEHLKAQANHDKSQKDWKRSFYLVSKSALSEQKRDDALYAYESAKAELQRTEAALKTAQIEYSYTSINAPISGIVAISKSDEGSYIDSQNATLTTITSLDDVYAEFSIPHSDVIKYLSQIKLGATLSININQKSYLGKIDYISSTLDSQTDTLFVRAKFDNSARALMVGSFVEVSLSGLSYKNVATVAQNALIKSPNATLVYLVKEGAVVMQAVDILDIYDGKAIVSGGLSSGDMVVTSNIAKLRPSSKVSIIGGN